MVALSDAQKKANEKYIKNNYKQVKLSMPNAEAEALERYCEIKNLTKVGFIRQAIKDKMDREPKTQYMEMKRMQKHDIWMKNVKKQ